MKRRRLVVALTAVALFAALTPAAAQDAVKAEIRQAIDAAYLNALNSRDIKTFLAGWDQGAVSALLSSTGEVTFQPVMEVANNARNFAPPEKKEFTYLYPAIDVTGNIGMAQVEVMRGETIRFTGYLPVVKTRTGWKMVGYTFHFHEDGVRPGTPAGEADAVKKVVEDTLLRGLMQDNSNEQVLAGISPGCEVSRYLPEHDLVTKEKLPPEFKSGGIRLTVKNSAFTLIGISGHAAAGKLAVTLAPPATIAARPFVVTMYVALYKLKTGWKIAQITEADQG
ncbi:MAG: hypothetical protein EHM90_04545 [Chloroflexi bacterium]|nr:MAG: hypothetical protein EHM90_04545 [Chloroflexota bacterium]